MDKTIIGTVGGLIVGGAMVIGAGNISASPVIQVTDDGLRPRDQQKVLITTTETKEVVETTFDGTLSDITKEILPSLYKERDRIATEITKYEDLRDTVQEEVDKLPTR